MKPEVALLEFLKTGSPSFSGVMGDRVYPVDFPQNPTFPACIYQTVSAPRGHTQQGADGLTPFRFQLRFAAATHDEVTDLRDLLDELTGTYGDVATGSPVTEGYVHGFFILSEADDALPSLRVVGPRLFGKRVDVQVWLNT